MWLIEKCFSVSDLNIAKEAILFESPILFDNMAFNLSAEGCK